MNRILLALTLALVGAGSAAASESPCRGPAPTAGANLRGPVLHVLDGRTLCVATGTDPSQWTEVILDDAPPAASWGGLMSVAFGKDVTCIARDGARTAVCHSEGRSIGEQLGAAGIERAGLSWKAPNETRAAPSPQSRSLRVANAGL
jgi:hypothetical protein